MRYLIALLLCCSMLMAAPPIGYNDPTIGGLMAWWTFNEASGTNIYDYSGNNYKGYTTSVQATGINTIWTNGIVRTGLFVTTNAIPFTSITFNPTNNTLAFWIRPISSGPVNNNYGPIIQKSDGTVGIYWINGSSAITYYDTTKGWQSSNGLVPSNQWTHCVIDNFNLYTNGGFAFAFTNILKTITLNAMAGDSLEWLNGTLDDVRIYNRALSSDEILKLYNGGYGSQK